MPSRWRTQWHRKPTCSSCRPLRSSRRSGWSPLDFPPSVGMPAKTLPWSRLNRRLGSLEVRLLSLLIALAAIVTAAAAARADSGADEAAVRQRLERWTAAFNARDAQGACDLFAPTLAYSLQEVPNGTYQTMCGNLTKLLARSDIRLHYALPSIHEIAVSGDIAVVRL